MQVLLLLELAQYLHDFFKKILLVLRARIKLLIVINIFVVYYKLRAVQMLFCGYYIFYNIIENSGATQKNTRSRMINGVIG